MTDDKPRGGQPDDQTQPVRPEGAPVEQPAAAQPTPPAADAAYAAEAPAGRRGFRERFRRVRGAGGNRAFSLGALLASALAGVIVGGLGTSVVHAVTHDDRPGWSEQRGPMSRDFGDQDQGGDDRQGPGFGGPGGAPGGVQPTTPPEEESDSGSDEGSNS